jgi:hypothetical protein
MSGYSKIIMETLGCAEGRAAQIETIMREDIFHSTLDWQSREELEEAACEADNMLNEQYRK